MLSFVMGPVEGYALAHTKNESPILHELYKETFAKTKIPHMQVGHRVGALLRLLVRITNSKRVLEIGTFTGYSALVMAEGLPDDGELITLDIDKETTDIAMSYWARSPHGNKIKLILGPALETLNNIDGLFDFVFIDADKVNYTNYWEACLPKIRKGGLIVADNVLWSGRVLNPKDENSIALDSFNKQVLSDSRVEAVMLIIRDGLTLAMKL
ncbi:MAG: class I SAM-dependent methyltransferase [Candidatus Melainabacteria bacterium]|nr:class I SAM-dependent methyltransferase [Candidatus Melainabacteria bacterium]